MSKTERGAAAHSGFRIPGFVEKVRLVFCSKGLRTLTGFAKTTSLALRNRRGNLLAGVSGIRNLTTGLRVDVSPGTLAVDMVYMTVQQWAVRVHRVRGLSKAADE